MDKVIAFLLFVALCSNSELFQEWIGHENIKEMLWKSAVSLCALWILVWCAMNPYFFVNLYVLTRYEIFDYSFCKAVKVSLSLLDKYQTMWFYTKWALGHWNLDQHVTEEYYQAVQDIVDKISEVSSIQSNFSDIETIFKRWF